MNMPLHRGISIESLQSVQRPIVEATGVPNAAYTDQSAFEFERNGIFAAHWAAVGFVDSLEHGMVRPLDFMGLPILLSRSKNGELKVFHNVCSHRGMKLVNEEKKTNGLIVCPYHTWTYTQGGELKATPHIGGVNIHTVDGFSCANRGLREIRSHVWLGIIFINLDGNARRFDEDAAPVISRYQALMGIHGEQEMRKASSHASLAIDVQCNWKLAVENYLEAYHLPFIHPSLNSYSPLEQHYNEIIADNCSGQVTRTFDPKLDQHLSLPVFSGWDSARFATGEYPVLYPNLLLGFQANHIFAMIIHPLSPSACREEVMLFYVGDDANADCFDSARENNLQTWAGVFAEDVEPCERMQIGRSSPGFTGGAFSPVHDTCSHHFHQWIAAHYLAGCGT